MGSMGQGPPEQIVQIQAGDAHNLVITSKGRMFTFGWNAKGQCGQGNTRTAIFAPTLVDRVLEEADCHEQVGWAPKWVCAAGGKEHSLALCSNGYVYATGSNERGTLGMRGLSHAMWFSKVHTAQRGNATKVFAGVDHSFILLDEAQPFRDEPVSVDEDDILEEYKERGAELITPGQDGDEYFDMSAD